MADGCKKNVKRPKGFYARKKQAEKLVDTASKDRVLKAMGKSQYKSDLKLAINIIGIGAVTNALKKKKKA